jgi:hypothetical protein
MSVLEEFDEIDTVLNEWLRIRITATEALSRIARIVDESRS